LSQRGHCTVWDEVDGDCQEEQDDDEQRAEAEDGCGSEASA